MAQLTEARTTGSFGTLVDVVASGGVLILSGAGLSTEPGIPDYRGPTGLARGATPMTYQTFTGSAAARRRYWARSYAGWRHIAGAEPNEGHRAVAELSRRGLLAGIITQNALVVLGSSLTVMSGFRYLRHAAKLQHPIVIVNQGATRGDAYATATLDAPLGQALTELVTSLGLAEGAGVGGGVDLAQAVHRDQGVDLGRGDGRVAE